MPPWKGIIGESFTPDAFDSYVKGLTFGAWRPQFVVLHNTAIPRLADWHSVSGTKRMQGLASYYKGLKWSAGPHLFVADDLIWVFTPLTTSGVHAPSWNSISWGVEMVGDFSTEPFDSGAGAKVQNNAVAALATLHAVMGLDSSSMRLHNEDPRTTHKGCPGKNVNKARMIQRVHDLIVARRDGKPVPEPVTPPAPTPAPARLLRMASPRMKGPDVKALQQALVAAGSSITPDGDFGAQTEAAVKAFQTKHKLTADGIVGPATRSALGITG